MNQKLLPDAGAAPCGPGEAQSSPAVARNRDPILGVLRRILPPSGTVLEIASGTGEHAVHFASNLPRLTWQPSDQDPDALRSIAAHRATAALSNLRAPLVVDATASPWTALPAAAGPVAAIVAINMIHIAPWEATEGLMQGAGQILDAGSVLYLYGPYRESGKHTAPSNAAFDASLKARNALWGVRDIDDVSRVASRHGLDFVERIAMPANNLSVIFRRRAA